jgi:hypothetical protein
MAWAFLFEFRVLQPTETIRTNPRHFFISFPQHFFMSHYQNHSDFYDKPVLLTADEMEDPYQIITVFFGEYPLSLVRETNRNIDQACLATDVAPFEQAQERESLMLYRWFETKLLEAAYVLLQSKPAAMPEADPSDQDTPTSNPPDPAPCSNEEMNNVAHLGEIRKRVIDIQLKVAELLNIVVIAWGEQALALIESQKKIK